MKREQKELIAEYKQTPRPMGILQIRNLADERVWLSASPNLPGAFNRHRFQLQAGNHPNAHLQADWNQLGEEGFAFEILDELTATGEPGRNYRDELAALEEMWLEKLRPYDERGYNQPELSRGKRLRMIARRRQEAASDDENGME